MGGSPALVSVEVVEWEAGVWCNGCMLPAAIRITIATERVGHACLQDVIVCPECRDADDA